MSTVKDIDAVIDRLDRIRHKDPDAVFDLVCMMQALRLQAVARESKMLDVLNRLQAVRSDISYYVISGGV